MGGTIKKNKHALCSGGFSLLELSIVLVVIGLLTGSILVAQNMIRSAQLQNVITELRGYQVAVGLFRDQYFALPGDMVNAEAFWGTDPDGCHDTSKSQTVHVETCNGNGDGKIAEWNRPGAGNGVTVAQYTERYTFWQHLANAGLIQGSYTANNLTTSSDFRRVGQVIGLNVPVSRVSDDTGWGLYTHHWSNNGNYQYYGTADLSQGSTATAGLSWGRGMTVPHAVANMLDDPVLTPKEAWNLDKKMDDGGPGTGKVMATDYATCTINTTASDDYDGEYNLTNDDILCALVFPEPF